MVQRFLLSRADSVAGVEVRLCVCQCDCGCLSIVSLSIRSALTFRVSHLFVWALPRLLWKGAYLLNFHPQAKLVITFTGCHYSIAINHYLESLAVWGPVMVTGIANLLAAERLPKHKLTAG